MNYVSFFYQKFSQEKYAEECDAVTYEDSLTRKGLIGGTILPKFLEDIGGDTFAVMQMMCSWWPLNANIGSPVNGSHERALLSKETVYRVRPITCS